MKNRVNAGTLRQCLFVSSFANAGHYHIRTIVALVQF